MSISGFSETDAPKPDLSTTEAGTNAGIATQRAANWVFGAQKLMFEELVFAGNEMFERTQTEMHLFSEYASKMAGAHSVKDLGTMYEECSKHQIEFVRRDCDRVLRHGERMIEAASKLLKPHPLD